MTNADRIRAMTDRQMARDLIPMIEEICEDGVPCEELFLDWLQSEAEQEEESVYEKCTNCHWYWGNNDTENECEGSDSVCHEFIPKK